MQIGNVDGGGAQPKKKPLALKDGTVGAIQEDWVFEIGEDEDVPEYEECDPDLCAGCQEEGKSLFQCCATGRCSWCQNEMCMDHFRKHLPCFPQYEDEEDELGLSEAVDQPWKQLWLIAAVWCRVTGCNRV